MEAQHDQNTLEQLATQRYHEILANEIIFNSEEEREKALTNSPNFFFGSLNFVMPLPGTTQITGNMDFSGRSILKLSGNLSGLGYTGEMTIPKAYGFLFDDPDSLAGTPLTIVMRYTDGAAPRIEINMQNSSLRLAGVIIGGPVALVPFTLLQGQMTLQKVQGPLV